VFSVLILRSRSWSCRNGAACTAGGHVTRARLGGDIWRQNVALRSGGIDGWSTEQTRRDGRHRRHHTPDHPPCSAPAHRGPSRETRWRHWRHGVVVSGVRRTNEVNPRRARLVLEWVTRLRASNLDQLDHTQTICTVLHTTPHNSIFTDRMLFLTPNRQCQSTKGNC